MYEIQLEEWFAIGLSVAIAAGVLATIAIGMIVLRRLAVARRAHTASEQRRTQINAELDRAQAELGARAQEAASLRASLQSHIEQVDLVQVELETSRSRVVDLQAQVSIRTSQLAQAEGRLTDIQSALSQAETQLETTLSRLSRHEQLVVDQQAALAQLGQQVAEIQLRHQSTAKLNSEQQATIGALTEQLAEARGQLAEAQQEIARQHTAAAGLATQLKDAQTVIADQTPRLAELVAKVDESAGQVARLTAESRERLDVIRALSARAHELETSLEESEVTIGEQRSVITDLSAEFMRVQAATEEQQARVEALTARLAEKEREVGRLGQELEVARGRVVDGELQLAERLVATKQLQAQVERLSVELHAATAALSDYRARAESAEPEVVTLREASDRMRLLLAERELEIATLKESAADLESRLRLAGKELEERQSFLDLTQAPVTVQALLHEAYHIDGEPPQPGSLLSRLTSALRETQFQLSQLEERSVEQRSDMARLSDELNQALQSRRRSDLEAAESKIALESLAQRFHGQMSALEELTKQASESKLTVADLRRQLRDAEDRYAAVKRRQTEWQREQDEFEKARARADEMLEDARREAHEQRRLAQNLSQQLAKLTAATDAILLEGVRGVSPDDAERLRAAGIQTVRDLASTTPDRLDVIVGRRRLIKPDYSAWIRHARAIARQQFGQEYVA